MPSAATTLRAVFAAAAEKDLFYDETLDPIAQLVSVSSGCGRNTVAPACESEAACEWHEDEAQCSLSEHVATALLQRPSCSSAWAEAADCRNVRSESDCTGGCSWSTGTHSCLLSDSIFFDGISTGTGSEYFDGDLCMDDAWDILSSSNMTCADVLETAPCHMELFELFPNVMPHGVPVHSMCQMSCGKCGGDDEQCLPDEDLKVDLTFSYLNPTLVDTRTDHRGKLPAMVGDASWTCEMATSAAFLSGFGGCSSLVVPDGSSSSVLMRELCPQTCGTCNATSDRPESSGSSSLLVPALRLARTCWEYSGEAQCGQACEWNAARMACAPRAVESIVSILTPLQQTQLGHIVLSWVEGTAVCGNRTSALCVQESPQIVVPQHNNSLAAVSGVDAAEASEPADSDSEIPGFQISYSIAAVIGGLMLAGVAGSAMAGMIFQQKHNKRKFDDGLFTTVDPNVRQRFDDGTAQSPHGGNWRDFFQDDESGDPFLGVSPDGPARAIPDLSQSARQSAVKAPTEPFHTVVSGAATWHHMGRSTSSIGDECGPRTAVTLDAVGNDRARSSSDSSDTSYASSEVFTGSSESAHPSSVAPARIENPNYSGMSKGAPPLWGVPLDDDGEDSVESGMMNNWLNRETGGSSGSEFSSPDPWGALDAAASATCYSSSSSNSGNSDDDDHGSVISSNSHGSSVRTVISHQWKQQKTAFPSSVHPSSLSSVPPPPNLSWTMGGPSTLQSAPMSFGHNPKLQYMATTPEHGDNSHVFTGRSDIPPEPSEPPSEPPPPPHMQGQAIWYQDAMQAGRSGPYNGGRHPTSSSGGQFQHATTPPPPQCSFPPPSTFIPGATPSSYNRGAPPSGYMSGPNISGPYISAPDGVWSGPGGAYGCGPCKTEPGLAHSPPMPPPPPMGQPPLPMGQPPMAMGQPPMAMASDPVKVAYEPRKRHLSREMQEQLSGAVVLLAASPHFGILQLASPDVSPEGGPETINVVLHYGTDPAASKWLLAVVINDIFIALGGGQPRHRPSKWCTVQRNILWNYRKRSGLNQVYDMHGVRSEVENWAYTVKAKLTQPLDQLVSGSIEWTQHVTQDKALATAKLQDSVPTLYKCPVDGCDFSSPKRRYIMGHMRAHGPTNSFPCAVPGCGYTSHSNQHLVRHMRVHTGERPFKCQWKGCNYAAGQRSHLQTHMLKHTGERPFKCTHSDCTFATTRRWHLDRHVRSHSPAAPV